MKDLIERLEKATGPDRELDAAIYVVTGLRPKDLQRLGYEVELWAERGNVFWRGGTVTQGPAFKSGETFPAYTASLDSALTLVPDFINRRWYAADSDSESDGKPVASVFHPADVMSGRIPRSVGATPAIALCIAALKARAASERDMEARR